jgi:O-Antigen ligase
MSSPPRGQRGNRHEDSYHRPAMVFEPAATAEPEAPSPERGDEHGGDGPRIELQVAAAILAALPAGLVIYLGFNGGGFFPGTVAFASIIVSQFLIARVLLADAPYAGLTRRAAIVGGAGLAFVAWVLLSATWSHARDRALIEFDRDLFYLLLFVLFALVPRTARRIPWMTRALAGAIFVVGAAGLITRLLPHVWPTAVNVANNRLSFPLTYWNALGILCGIGILLSLGLASSRTELRPVRALACGAVPVLGTTLYFTFSRGAIAATIIGAVVYIAAARSPRIWAAFVATLPPTAVAVVVAYNAKHLSSAHPATAGGVSEGHRVVVVVVLCALAAIAIRAALLRADGLLDRRREPVIPPQSRRPVALGGLALIVVVALAIGVPGWISHEYHGFTHGTPVNSSVDLRTRLTDPSSNGRIDHWRAASQADDSSSFHGVGIGTYQFEWEKRRKSQTTVVDAHGIYPEVLGEVGLVGLAILLVFFGGIGYGIARRATGPNRVLYAALLGAFSAWAIHAGVDWDWEMPVVTAWVFAVGGAALARRSRDADTSHVTPNSRRIPVAAALAVTAVTPALLLFSQSHLQRAAKAFDRGDCPAATREARSSIDALAIRPEPYQILGYCDLIDGRPTDAAAAFQKAIDQEPRSWEYRYGLALARADAGLDPRAALAQARVRNPREPLIKSAIVAFRSAPQSRWPKLTAGLRDDAISSGRLSVR